MTGLGFESWPAQLPTPGSGASMTTHLAGRERVADFANVVGDEFGWLMLSASITPAMSVASFFLV
jgi:hypothetical protein